MLKSFLGVLMLFSGLSALAQETFDVVTYTPPAGWEKEDLQGKAVAFTRKDARSGTWGRIAVYKSVKGSGNLQSDFASEWNLLAAKPYAVGQPSRTEEGIVHNGWRSKGGLAQFTFNNAPAGVSLTTISNGELTLSVLVLLSSNIHQHDVDKFMASINLPAIAAQTRAAPPPQADSSTKPRIIGNWSHSASSSPQDWKAASWSGAGYTTRRYEFKEDGTYRFTMRSFFMMNPDIYIVKEHGTFTISGQQLTVVPQSSVFETYLKKNNVDELGSLKATKKRSLDPVTYTTTLNYSRGMREWNLVLQTSKPTERDGNFDSNTLFNNAWFYDQRFDAELTSSTGK